MNPRRRRSLIALGSAVFLAPRILAAQQPVKVYRVANLGVGSPTTTGVFFDNFKKGLRDLGYIEEQNIVIDARWAEGKAERLPGLAAELAALNPDVIIASGTPGTRAAKQATATIPIVMIGVADPVGAGLVASLAHPGGNITGVSNLSLELSGKTLELLHAAVPKATRIAVLMSDDPIHSFLLKEIQDAAKGFGLTVLPTRAKSPEELERAFASIANEKAQAVIVLADVVFSGQRKRIAELAAQARLPSMYQFREHTEAGGLLSYGPDSRNLQKVVATYVDKILKGAKPGDLPVQQPTEFELVINLKTAKALGITFPQEILLRADKVI